MSKNLAYIRASTQWQEIKKQRYEILAYAAREKIAVDGFIESALVSNGNSRQERIDELMTWLKSGDLLLVTELSLLGRSTGEVIILVDQLLTYGISLSIIKQNVHLNRASQDLATRAMVNLFDLLAGIEKDFISEQTRKALAAQKAEGVILGKPRGTIQNSIYDKDRDRIAQLLALGVSQRQIVEKHLGYGTSNSLNHYIRTRGMQTGQSNPHDTSRSEGEH